MHISICNGRVIDPANNIDEVIDLHIANGKIIGLGQAPDGFTATQTIDATDRLVTPGLVDLSVRLREPGLEHKGTIASETRAAAAGGVTTVTNPPDTFPVTDTPAVIELIRHRAEQAGHARVLCLGASTQGLKGQNIAEMGALLKAGCVGMSNAWAPVASNLVRRRIMEYAATYDLTVFLHAEDSTLRNSGCMHEGAVSTRLGLPGIPTSAETVAVARDLALIEETGVKAHFCRISSDKAIQKISRAQGEGLPITVDASAQHLYLTDMDLADFNSQCHFRPPLRGQRDMQGLRHAILHGNINAICSDHQPHEADAKLVPFRESASGASTLETLLPLTLRLAEETRLSLSQALACVTHKPAQILGQNLGTLSIHSEADVIIIDPEQYWTVDQNTLMSRGHNTPFLGWEVKGRVTHTFLGGKLVHQLDTQ